MTLYNMTLHNMTLLHNTTLHIMMLCKINQGYLRKSGIGKPVGIVALSLTVVLLRRRDSLIAC